MKKIVKLLEKLLKYLPPSLHDKFFELVLLYIPFRVLQLIPCSYSTYLKCYYPQKGDVVVDAGAHIGNCALLFSRLVEAEGLVIAFEPFQDSYDKLVKRIQRLKLTNIIAVNKGLYSEDTELSLTLFSDTTLGANISNEVDKEVLTDSIKIQCTKLDTIVSQLKLGHIEMVKMDIEGAEIEALSGAINTMADLSPCFAIASYHIRNKEKTYKEVEKCLVANGYSVNTFFPPHLTTCGVKGKRKLNSSGSIMEDL